MNTASDDTSPLAGLHLLMVEDEMMLAMSLADLLERAGCKVAKAPSIDKALALIERETLDGALLDINVRGTHVYPVADALAEREVPFVFMTGYDESAIEENWRDRPVVRKPFTIETLEQAAATTFARRA
jgi:CheY-like chemotaxis protein